MSVEPNSGKENVPKKFDYVSPKNAPGNSVLLVDGYIISHVCYPKETIIKIIQYHV